MFTECKFVSSHLQDEKLDCCSKQIKGKHLPSQNITNKRPTNENYIFFPSGVAKVISRIQNFLNGYFLLFCFFPRICMKSITWVESANQKLYCTCQTLGGDTN